jgi:Ion channel
MKFFRELFLGKGEYEFKKLTPAIKNQYNNFKKVWNDSLDKTFGVERILRLILVLLPYLFPSLYIRHISGKKGILARKIVVEIYVVLKLLYPMIILYFHFYNNLWVLIIVIYLMSETLMYLLGLVFLSDIYIKPISYKRSIILLFMNYVETTLGFAIIYFGFGLIKNMGNGINAVYYSLVTSTTLGYGDYIPKGEDGQIVVIMQIIVMLFYIILFFNKTVMFIDRKYIKNKNGI